MKINRKVCIVGVVIGIIIAIFGALIFFEAIDFGVYSSGESDVLYENGYATFGADYYTYTVNNIAKVSTYIQRTMKLILKFLGSFLFCTGTFNTLFFAAIKGSKEVDNIKIIDENLPEL